VRINSTAQIQVEVTDKDGKKILKRTPVEKLIPGTEVIFTTTIQNIIDQPANDIIINKPVPNDTEYLAGSAFGSDCEILFSADGGKTFAYADELTVKDRNGKRRGANPREYTNIRWYHKVPLAAGKSAEVGFRAVIK
ncbi:MAG TPA: hypothetical protein VGD24_07235, partial [Gallionella sp.]